MAEYFFIVVIAGYGGFWIGRNVGRAQGRFEAFRRER